MQIPKRVAVLFCLVVWSSALAQAQTNPVRLAEQARLNLVAAPEVGVLTNATIISGSGFFERRNLPTPAERDGTYKVSFPITRFTTNEFAFSFVPQATGPVNLELMGPHEDVTNGIPYREEVIWESLQVTGANIPNDGWKNLRRPVRAWYNDRRILTLNVRSNTPVSVRVAARPVIPANFVEMKRFTGRDTPAHRAAKKFRRGATFLGGGEAAPILANETAFTTGDFAILRAEGFDHVRLPVAWQFYAGPGPAFTITNALFAKVDYLVTNALKNGLSVILDQHAYDTLSANPAGHADKFFALWKQVAAHYAQAPTGLAFELLHEPDGALTNAVLNGIYAEAIRLIRLTNPLRTIFVAPGKRSNSEELYRLRLPDYDDNLIVTIHCHDPFYFTHQWDSWAGPNIQIAPVYFPGPPLTPLAIDPKIKLSAAAADWFQRYNTQTTDKNPSSSAAFRPTLQLARTWSEFYGRPVHVGEFGASNMADPVSRARYYQAFREALDDAGMGWATSGWKNRFKYWDPDTRQAMPGLHEALFPTIVLTKNGEVVNAKVASMLDQLKEQFTNSHTQAKAEIEQLKTEVATTRSGVERTRQNVEHVSQQTRWLVIGLAAAAALLVVVALVQAAARRRHLNALLPVAVTPGAGEPTVICIPGGGLNLEAAARAGLLPHIARFLGQRFVQRLIAQRKELLETQLQAAQELAELEKRLEQIHAPLQDRLIAYEQRITELERQLADKGDENQALLKAQLLLTKKHMEVMRSRNRLEWN